MSLVPVHGGLDQLVDRVLTFNKKKALLSEAGSLPKIQVNEADLATMQRIADGTLSPLTGPMNQDVANQVLDTQTITNKGKKYAWTVPFSLPVTDEEAAKLKVGGQAALVDGSGNVVGALKVGSIFDWDKAKMVEKVYRTKRTDHPGAKIIVGDARTKLVGGEIEMLPAAVNPSFGEYVLGPRRTRALIAERKYEAMLAFQTRNPLHRAHEYALVYGAEKLTRDGKYAGVALHPLVGQLKGDDVNAEMRMKTYVNLVKHRLLGKGDSDQALWEKVGYDINDVFHLIGLDMRMLYGGPSEAVMHAIYRQNSGFSHIVIGRKHADAPYDDKTPIWGDFDAQEIFNNLPGELHTKPVNVGFAAFYESINRVDLTENHKDEKPFAISGTGVRDALVAGQRPDPRIMRPETADTLIEAYKK
jgi:sulfate adenylyltransferase